MSAFTPVRQLFVHRRLSNGEKVAVGQLAQNTQGVFFQYDENYIAHYHNLSPFKLTIDNQLQAAPAVPHAGLHGVFGDSLPDGWGLLLMNRAFRRHGIPHHKITVLDRLAYIGEHGMGALSYTPASVIAQTHVDARVDLAQLGHDAEALYEGTMEEVLPQLAIGGSSAGARPKSQIFIDSHCPEQVSTQAKPGLEPWLIKFTADPFLLGHEEGLCEAAYLKMASMAGIDVPQWQLTSAPAKEKAIAWLTMRRFDCTSDKDWQGRYHVQSLCALLDADFRQPSLDYMDIIGMGQTLCQSPAVGQKLFRRAMFNLFSGNQDDHCKNAAFLMDDKGEWTPTPAYDLTFSPTPYGEHTTSFDGYGKAPPLKVIQKMADHACFKDWSQAKGVIQEVMESISQWVIIANELGISRQIKKQIHDQLNILWKENRID